MPTLNADAFALGSILCSAGAVLGLLLIAWLGALARLLGAMVRAHRPQDEDF